MSVKVKVINKSSNPLPVYKTPGSAGMDVASSQDLILHPGFVIAVPTGLYFEIPDGYEIQVRSRSGLAYKSGVFVINSPGTIDSDYRGEIKVLLTSVNSEPFEIKEGDRIGQIVLQPVTRIQFEEAEELEETERGDGGFGSTGV